MKLLLEVQKLANMAADTFVEWHQWTMAPVLVYTDIQFYASIFSRIYFPCNNSLSLNCRETWNS